jgi:TonB family protein
MKHIFIFAIVLVAAVSAAGQSAPRVLNNPDPVYPPETAELGYGGSVKLAIKVGKDGKVKVIQAWGPVAPCSNLNDARIKKIREAVIDAASKVTFEPILKDGKPPEVEMNITYSFDSTGKPARSKEPSGSKGRIVESGVLMGRVKHMARPDYPASARASRISGAIPVGVLVDVDGRVIAASALGGHRLLQESAVDAACRSSIEPVQLSGQPVQVSGVITFTFVA